MDTFLEEKLSDADVDAALSGRIFKHSKFFYEQKIAYTEPMLSREDTPSERYDDLAVAWDKVGNDLEALRVIDEKERRFPGLYTTRANRGTFLAHLGRYEEGILELEKAVGINPNAHFGREHYQLRALRWLLRLKEDPTLSQREDFLGFSLDHFYEAFRTYTAPPLQIGVQKVERETWYPLPQGVSIDVFEALVGLLRFGNALESPPVWFSLGISLAAFLGPHERPARAFRRAANLGHPLARAFGEIALDGETWESAKDIDENFEEGMLEMKQRAEREDERLQKGWFQGVFGY